MKVSCIYLLLLPHNSFWNIIFFSFNPSWYVAMGSMDDDTIVLLLESILKTENTPIEYHKLPPPKEWWFYNSYKNWLTSSGPTKPSVDPLPSIWCCSHSACCCCCCYCHWQCCYCYYYPAIVVLAAGAAATVVVFVFVWSQDAWGIWN